MFIFQFKFEEKKAEEIKSRLAMLTPRRVGEELKHAAKIAIAVSAVVTPKLEPGDPLREALEAAQNPKNIISVKVATG